MKHLINSTNGLLIVSFLDTIDVVAKENEVIVYTENPLNYFQPKYNFSTQSFYENLTPEEISNLNSDYLALFECYPELKDLNYKLIQLDNLEGIEREVALSDKGLKGEKKYFKDGQLIWSSQKKYWFEQDSQYTDGFIRKIKLFKVNGDVADTWNVKVKLSPDDKQLFLKQQREMIFEYLKSQQLELFTLLYTFFPKEINDYIMADGNHLANTLTIAATNHEVELVRQTLSMVVPTQSGGTTTVLAGILAELI